MVPRYEKHKRTFWESFVEHYRLTFVFVIGVVLLGFFSIMQMPKESSPEIDFPIAVVTTPFLGASAADVEELVTDPLEDKINTLTDIESVQSVSSQGISSITVNFDVNADSLEAMTDLRDRVDAALSDLPSDAETPIVQKVSFSDVPIMQLAVAGPYQPAQLKEFAEAIEEEIESVSGVSEVDVIGAPEREVRVLVRGADLDQHNLSILQVVRAIQGANTNLPVGSIESSEEIYNVRFAGQLFAAEEIKAVPVGSVEQNIITVGDVARVIDSHVDANTIARLSVGNEEPRPSVSLQVFKSPGGNILDLADEVVERIDAAKGGLYPENVQVEVVSSDADYIRTDLRNLTLNGFGTVLIIVLLLMLFLGFREAMLASIAVPLTFLMTFTVLNQFGFTINFLTLFSLILSLGILVDGAIVVTEGMHTYLEKGKSPKDAAAATIREFKTPLIAGTATTIFVFLPMVLTSGIIGEFIKSIPVAVTIVLVSSIIVALGVITAFGSRFLRADATRTMSPSRKRINAFIERVYNRYSQLLNQLLNNAKKRTRLFRTMTALFFASLMLPIFGILQVNMFPPEDLGFFTIDIEKPIGTPLDETDELAKQVEEVLLTDDRIKSFLTNVGSGTSIGVFGAGGSGSTHVGSFVINLYDDRKESSIDIIEEYADKFTHITDGKVKVSQLASGPDQGAPVNVQVIGPDLDTLEAQATKAKQLLEQIEGTRDVEMSVKESNGEFVLSIDRSKAEFFGVNTAEVASVLRSAVTGNTATVLKKDGNDIDVVVKYDFDPLTNGAQQFEQINIDQIGSLTVLTPKGAIPMSSFLSDDLADNRPSIQHEDGERLVRVTSQVEDKFNAQAIVGKFQQRAEELGLPEGYSLSYGGESESINQSFSDLFRAMFLGMFMIAGLLIWQFRSYRQPLFVMSSIPLSLIGVFTGLALVGEPLSFPAFIGVVALAGIVVNNAIILIDRINENRVTEHMDIDTAIREAATSRLQPILLTTITTVSGLLPLAITNPSWGPLGYSIVFGLMFSSVLTLFVVPLLYQRFGEKTIDA